ncbi:MAG: DsbA family protein [Pseudomonadota bacterium]
MARPVIEYFYATHSAYAYLGAPRLYEICAHWNCTLIHRPFELSPVVEHAGGQPFAGRSQAHVDYFFGRELERWAAFRGLPMLSHRPTHHDQPLTLSSGLLIAAIEAGTDIDALSFAILQAHWRDDINLMEEAALLAAARSAGIEAKPFLDRSLEDDIQAILEENTAEAKRLCLFGSPTYILDGDPYYGQDHLELLAAGLEDPFPASSFRNPAVGQAT